MSNKRRRIRPAAPGVDRRARRTRMALAEALMDLVPKKGIERVQVGQLAKAAGIGRSTFYKHYADKDDFFITSFANMIASMDAHARAHRRGYDTMLPAHEVFAHVADARSFALSLGASGELARTHSAREDRLRVVAEANLKRFAPARPAAERQEIAVILAGTFASLMRWWVEGGLRHSAKHVATLYDSVARSVLR
jgi:AcrR family transcriptional regulator